MNQNAKVMKSLVEPVLPAKLVGIHADQDEDMLLDDDTCKHQHEAEEPVLLEPGSVGNSPQVICGCTGTDTDERRNKRPLDAGNMFCLFIFLCFHLLRLYRLILFDLFTQ